MHLPNLRSMYPFFAVLILFSATTAISADSSKAVSRDSLRKRVEWKKTFLLRTSDELSRTMSLVKETTDLLIAQAEANAVREPDRKRDELLSLLDWYQTYGEWLKGLSSELEQDMGSLFTKQKLNSGWTLQYEQLDKGNKKFAGELEELREHLEGEKKKVEIVMQKLNTVVLERRVLVDKDDLALAQEIRPTYHPLYDHREAAYLELSDEEVLYFRSKLKSLEERQAYFKCLTELGKYEQGWMDIKATDFSKLSEIAGVIDDESPGAAMYAFRSAIRSYEANAASLRRKSEELEKNIHGVTRTGTLATLDHMEALSRHYEQMKSRYERHGEWLKAQIGSYQADLIEIDREL